MKICIFFVNKICNIFLNMFPKAQCIIKLCYGYSTPMMNANEILLMGSDLLPLFSTLFLCRGWDITFDVCMCEVNQRFLIYMTCWDLKKTSSMSQVSNRTCCFVADKILCMNIRTIIRKGNFFLGYLEIIGLSEKRPL